MESKDSSEPDRKFNEPSQNPSEISQTEARYRDVLNSATNTLYTTLAAKRFEKHLPPQSTRKKETLGHIATQMQNHAIKSTNKQLNELIKPMRPQFQIVDFLKFRQTLMEDVGIQIEEFDEEEEFLKQLLKGLQDLRREVRIEKEKQVQA